MRLTLVLAGLMGCFGWQSFAQADQLRCQGLRVIEGIYKGDLTPSDMATFTPFEQCGRKDGTTFDCTILFNFNNCVIVLEKR